ncbi:MAG: hypothetical protein CMQ53_02095 [Gammaproteobacteria bacterium]|nr:hypothetical protein [Gammaproteobacteria bacterium]
MSLTVSSNSTNSNLSENWLFQLYNQDSYLSFDGTDDYINLGTTTASSAINLKGVSEDDGTGTVGTGISVSFFVNFPEVGNREIIFASNSTATYSGYWIEKNPDDKIAFNWGNDGGAGQSNRRTMIASPAVSANTWYHVIITSTFANTTDGTFIYINNVAQIVTADGTASVTTPNYVSDGKAYIGREDFTATNYGGKLYLKNLAIWAGILDSSNRTAIYNSGNFLNLSNNYSDYTQASNLVGYFQFNNGENYIKDEVGNALDGTIYGTTYKDYLPISFKDTVVDDVFYHGVITNSPSIRTSIDLINSTSQTGEISLNVANFNYKGNDFSYELYGTRKYLHKTVKVYSQLNGSSSIFQIYHGDLRDIKHDNKSIQLNITEKQEWEKIDIPNVKYEKLDIYEPIVYGQFTPATIRQTGISTSPTNDGVFGTVYPVDVISATKHAFMTLTARSYTQSDNAYMHYPVGVGFYLPISGWVDFSSTAPDGDTASTTIVQTNVNTITTPTTYKASGFWSPLASEFNPNTVTLFTDKANAFIVPKTYETTGFIDTSNYAKATISSQNTDPWLIIKTIDRKFVASLVSKVVIRMGIYPDNTANTQNQFYNFDFYANWPDLDNIKDLNSQVITNLDSGSSTGSDISALFDTAPNNGYDTGSSDANLPSAFSGDAKALVAPDELHINFDVSTGPPSYIFASHELRVFGVKIYSEVGFRHKDDEDSLQDVDKLYCGGNGLLASGNWKTADSGLIKYGHEAHRDALIRFAGVSKETPTNWSSGTDLNNSRSTTNWRIRHWQNKNIKLKNYLDKLAKEFGFIYKKSGNGKSSYIYIQNSYSSSNVNHIITKSDIATINIQKTFNDVVSKIRFNTIKDAKTGRYLIHTTGINENSRNILGFNKEKNEIELNLDANVGIFPEEPNSSPNSDLYSYMDNIQGSPKITVSCKVVSQKIKMSIETGDIVEFADMPVNPFSQSWTDLYFMVTKVLRTTKDCSIELREVR